MGTQGVTLAEAALRRERWITGAALAALTLLAWLFVLDGAGTGMSVRAMTTWSFPPPARPAMDVAWDAQYWAVMVVMWWVMMIAMMVPSAAPMVLLYARVARHGQRRGRMAAGAVPTGLFLAGYLVAWLGYSIAATVAQWALVKAALVDAMLMWSVDATFSGLLLIAAGLYQLTPVKRACLEHCRAPAEYLARAWRPGGGGAFAMGAVHGSYCLGCCWGLMALLFVGGIMNMVWIAGLAILVILEKLTPFGAWLARAGGLAMAGAGGYLIVAG